MKTPPPPHFKALAAYAEKESQRQKDSALLLYKESQSIPDQDRKSPVQSTTRESPSTTK